MNLTISQSFQRFALGAGLIATIAIGAPRPAQANTTSTAFIIAGAAAIVGALLVDSQNKTYYVKNNKRYYVTPDEATYYRSHHKVVERKAYVPENEYPVAQSADARMQQQRNSQQKNGKKH
jgi:hypothetical protein